MQYSHIPPRTNAMKYQERLLISCQRWKTVVMINKAMKIAAAATEGVYR